MDIDFEGGTVVDNKTNGGTTETKDTIENQDTTSLDGNVDVDDVTGKDNTADDTDTKPNNDGTDNSESADTNLAEGDTVEFDGVNYTVDNKGNLVNDKGEVFKDAKELQDWLKENNFVDSNDDDSELSINAIKNAIGVDITDDFGNEVEFTNDAAGIKSYVNSVINLKSNELQTGAINKLFADNPMLKQFIDYVQLTGTPRGFGEIPDRSGIHLDKDNEAQLEAVIRMAAQEFGNKSLNDNYIKYLKSTGTLYDEARNQLSALVKRDEEVRNEITARAEAARQQEEEEVREYWNTVNSVILTRNINGIQLPESFVKEVNGQKITLTPDDFYNYLSRATEVDEEGNRLTGYQRDLNNLSNEEALNKELLDAWLMFTGGTYKDLIGMAAKEDTVRKLVVKSKQNRNKRAIKVVKSNAGKGKIDDIIF